MPKTYYVVCEDDCFYEGMTKEQIITAIEQAVETGSVSDPDSAVISKIKEIRANDTVQIWKGTEAQFNALSPAPTVGNTFIRVGTDGVLYVCTDDQQMNALLNHIANKNNPHEVTFSQVIGGNAVPVNKGGTGAITAAAARTNLGAASSDHNHSINNLNGILSVAKGGTGAITAAAARTNLGAASSDHNHSINNLNGILSVAKGGTGGTTPDEACANIGALRIVNYSNSYSAGCGDASMWFTYLQNGTNKCQIDLAQSGKLQVNGKDVITTDGGTVTGSMTFANNLWVSNNNSASGYVKMWEDNEGGNIEIGSPNGKSFQMDAYNDTNFRIFSQQSGSVKGLVFNGTNGNFYADGDIYSNSKKVSTADIQVGVASNVGTSGTNITFPRAFAGVPVVTANGEKQTSIRVYNITATGCTLTSGESNNTVQWQAIYIPS